MTNASSQTKPEYLLDTGTDLGREQFECLELLLDDHSTRALAAAGVRRGDRCLEIGAGAGSVARWMADRVRPSGNVVAVDIDTTRLASGPAMDVRRHDINDGVPDGGPFDIIHSRLVLMHLSRRQEIVTELIDALAPGGWLILGEYLGPRYDAIAAPSRADADLFHRVVETVIDRVGRPGGISYTWAHEIDDYLVRAGLVNVHSARHMETTVGGDTGCILYRNYIRQAAELIRRAGVSDDDLGRFAELMLDPRFRAWMFEYTSIRAQKPS